MRSHLMEVQSWRRRRRLMGQGGELTYSEKVLALGPIAYWPMWETSGATAECLVNPLQNGTYTGVTLGDTTGPDGVNSAPFFDGANDTVEINSAALNSVFNGTLGTCLIWGKVANLGVWTDGTSRCLVDFGVDVSNRMYLLKRNVNNQITFDYVANASGIAISENGLSPTNWQPYVFTWDRAGANEIELFRDNVSKGTDSPLDLWAGNLANQWSNIGSLTATPGFVFHGWLAHCVVWNRVLALDEIATVSTI